MPDLITHVSVAYFFNRFIKAIHLSTIFYLGSILPDILTRPLYILMPATYWAVFPLHTPVVLFITCLLFCFFFNEKRRKDVFVALLAGSYLHLFLDLLQKHIVPAYPLLFPFSWDSFAFGIIWPKYFILFAPLWALGVIAVEFYRYKKNR